MYFSVCLIIAVLSPTVFATDLSSFDPSTDGLVTNFENYQTFGGENAQAVKSVTYNVFLPSGMGFDPSTDTLEMKVSMPQDANSDFIAYESNLSSEAGTCQAVSNGYNFAATWDFTASWPVLTQGSYAVSFVVLNNDTMPVNAVYMDLLNGTGNNPLYAESGQVFIDEPLTTPYASFGAATQSLYSLVDPSSPSSITFTTAINAKNTPTNVDFYFDGNLIQDATNYNTVNDSSYYGRQVDRFSYTLNNVGSLTNGDHVLTAVANGIGYSVPVVTADGQSQVNIEAAYGSDRSCSAKASAINKITKETITQETTELDQIQITDNQVRTYFAKHQPTISSYSQLISNINSDNKNVDIDLAVLVKDNSFQCATISSQISAFIADLNKVYADLHVYETASVNLINKAGGL
jgi:hypothetical protein